MGFALIIILSTVLAPVRAGLGNVPYYKKQKEKLEQARLEELLRRCRNSRNVDPTCNQYYYAARTASAAADFNASNAATAFTVLAAIAYARRIY